MDSTRRGEQENTRQVGIIRWTALGAAAVLASAGLFSCLTTVCAPQDTACLNAKRSGGAGGGGEQLCVQYGGGNQKGEVCVNTHPVVCAGATCAEGSECCYLNGQCFDPITQAGSCPTPDGGAACASNSQCPSGQACITSLSPGQALCTGAGKCQPKTDCGECSPAGGPQCQRCGCDGNTYASIQEACVAGVRVAGIGACGVPQQSGASKFTLCGTDSQCGAEQKCCPLTGKCFSGADPWRCELDSTGVVLDCASNDECNSGAGGSGGSNRARRGSGCGTPGLCQAKPNTGQCGGQLEPVCGCDGKSYTNECWARAAGARVGANGQCSDGGNPDGG
jgi:hypothetical protein